MEKPGFVFFLGNKRSGTTHLVELLNLHPSVFVSHESDAIWILYQLAHRRPLRPYPWDGPVGMQATLESCSEIFQERAGEAPGASSIQELFLRIQSSLMKQGSRVQKAYTKQNIRWIGDKKPVQHADPEVFNFLRTHFPAARFIHLIRHPRTVVASMVEAGKTWGQVGYWENLASEEILERWVTHEEWVLDAKAEAGNAVLSLRFEDLCSNPVVWMEKIYGFLGLETCTQLNPLIRQMTRPENTKKYADFVLPESDKAQRILQIYGYGVGAAAQSHRRE